MTTLAVRSARYMTRFSCLGGACEDTCCAGWTVPVDEPTHRRLTVLSEHEPHARQLLTEGVELTPQGPDFARLRFGEDGHCGMLESDGLCAIHARLGADALADVCMTYPRYYNEVDGELELFGTVSCPEVARSCLLHADAFETDAQELDRAPRKLRNRFTTQPPYFRPFRELRTGLVSLLAAPQAPLDEKLFALLWFTNRVSAVVFEGCPSVPEAELKTALAALAKPELLQALGASYRDLQASGELALSIVQQALGAANGRSPNDAWQAYQQLRARVPSGARARLDECLTRYAINHLYTSPYMLSPSPLSHGLDLVVRVAALRYLLHERLAGFTGDARELDAIIVDVSYRFGRRIEHSGLFEKLARQLADQELASLAVAIGFISV